MCLWVILVINVIISLYYALGSARAPLFMDDNSSHIEDFRPNGGHFGQLAVVYLT